MPGRVHHRERAIAILDLRHDDTERVDIGELLELAVSAAAISLIRPWLRSRKVARRSTTVT
jgi:hypothetical protein